MHPHVSFVYVYWYSEENIAAAQTSVIALRFSTNNKLFPLDIGMFLVFATQYYYNIHAYTLIYIRYFKTVKNNNRYTRYLYGSSTKKKKINKQNLNLKKKNNKYLCLKHLRALCL